MICPRFCQLGRLPLVALLFWLVACLLPSPEAQAQGERKVIIFSGLVVQGDSAYGVPNVNVYVPRAGRGTFTDQLGFFSMPTLVGDTVVFSAVGFEKKMLVIPRRDDTGYSVLINLREAATYLPEVEILPYPTEELFKEAFVALQLPEQEKYDNMERNLGQNQMTRMSMAMPMDGGMNFRYNMNYQADRLATRNFATSIPLLNPFAWAQFIKSVKRGDLKKKD
ncbi:MAG: carboxypeptidase-like regulatory domain-containing protein [Bernardetiaceae bacterium]|jgi:hypothetical protein|nr:carboxypeptidase-like regulatory domain-containing protein [Bernardetiaceae bacterium]